MNSRRPPLADLRAFEAAARHLSFTRAASELGVTQGAVSLSFSLTGSTVSLDHVGGGHWLGTWTPTLSMERITGEIHAVAAEGVASTRFSVVGSVVSRQPDR